MKNVIFRRYLTLEEERKLLTTVKGVNDILAQRDYAWMRLLRHTGLRVGVLPRITLEQARRAIREKKLPYVSKRGKSGTVPVIKKAKAALLDLIAIRKQMGHPEIPDQPLIMSRNHKAMSIRSYQDRMKHWRQAAGLSVEASPHWFRHTLGKRIMQQSTSPDPRAIVQGVLNHSDISTTVIYTQPDREEMEEAMEQAS